MEQTQVSTPKFIGGAFIGVAIFSGAIIAMGGQLENADLTPDAPTAEQEARQNLAVQAHRISASSEALLADAPDSAELAAIHDVSVSYEEQLGGVWIPWPSGAPEGYTNPPLSTDPPAEIDEEALLAELQDFSQASLDAAEGLAPADRPTTLSMSLGSRLLGANYAQAVGLDTPMCGAADPVLAGRATTTPEMLNIADSSRQWIETDTARMDPNAREAQVERIAAIDAYIEAVLENDVPDHREAFAAYPSLSEGETYTQVGLENLTGSLITVAADSTSAEEREAVISLSCSLYVTSAERNAALPFPGVESAN
ncbi:MAG: hypothetical protein ACTH1Z_05585 [Ancrocorticia sp.]|uniref:hypothetical protein n=1 Tax=Ancrocorticia sp. TaxID=2593684 RepID=UPI003F904AD3